MDTVLKVENLDISFGGVHAVNDLSFAVERGVILGLIGPNGSGKSTTVNIISGLYRQDSGKVILDGVDLTRKDIAERIFRGIGRTFQSPKPFLSLTVFESVYISALLHNKNKQTAYEETLRVLDFMGFSKMPEIRCSKLPVEKRKWLDMARLLPAVTKICHRVVVLNEGKLLSVGPPAEVMRQEKVIKAYLGKGYGDA